MGAKEYKVIAIDKPSDYARFALVLDDNGSISVMAKGFRADTLQKTADSMNKKLDTFRETVSSLKESIGEYSTTPVEPVATQQAEETYPLDTETEE